MSVKQLTAGVDIPNDFNVVIEISRNGVPVKYEMCKETGVLHVDRFLSTSMMYPCDYGYIPQTLSEDGDPLDVLVVSPYPLLPGSVIRCKAVGMLRMTDESGPDAKILAVPVTDITPLYAQVTSPYDLGNDFLGLISHFFSHYKDFEPKKWVKIEGWEGIAEAKVEIEQGVKRFNDHQGQ